MNEMMVLFRTDKTSSVQKLTMLQRETRDVLANVVGITIIGDLCDCVERGGHIEGISDAEMQKIRTITSFFAQQQLA